MKKLIILGAFLVVAQPAQPMQNAQQKMHKMRPAKKLVLMGLGSICLGYCCIKKFQANPTLYALQTYARLGIILQFVGINALGQGILSLALKAELKDFISNGCVYWVWLWLILGADANERVQYDETLLMVAAQKGINGCDNDKIVKLLLKHGAHVNAEILDVTALMYAANAGHPSITAALIHAGADTLKTAGKYSALIAAKIRDHDTEYEKKNKPAIQRLLRFHIAKQELAPQISHLLYKKQAALLAKEVIEDSQEDSTGAHDITNIIKAYL